jgi:hypothetical protein
MNNVTMMYGFNFHLKPLEIMFMQTIVLTSFLVIL